jgi:hypothetical protein
MIQVHLEDCNGTHKLEQNHPGGFQCPDGKPVCFGQPACLCKEVKHSLISIRLNGTIPKAGTFEIFFTYDFFSVVFYCSFAQITNIL